MRFTYLFVDVVCVTLPFLFSFHPEIKFNREFKAFFSGNFISGLGFIIWDVIFTEKGIWGFNEEFVVGINVYNLPLEEILFFVCIPFACVFTYRCLNSFFTKGWGGNVEKGITFFFSVSFLLIGLWFWRRTYTATTFISFALVLFLIRFAFRQAWVGNLYRAWLILLFPFFIINGILTGTGLSSPVVWYNNRETMGVRVLTIPAEDFVYGLELVMLTVFFYELFLLFFKGAEAEGKDAIKLIVQQR